MKKSFRIVIITIAIILFIFLAIFIYRLLPNSPEVNFETYSKLTNATITQQQALDVVLQSEEYKDLDRFKRIEIIVVSPINIADEKDKEKVSEWMTINNANITEDSYEIRVNSDSRCSSTNYIIFLVGASSGEIISSRAMKMC